MTLQSPVFLVNSRLGLFTATAERFGREVLHLQRHTFSRSYGVNLPSSFAGDHSSALGFSPCLRVSVCGTVSVSNPHRGFSWQPGVTHLSARRPRTRVSGLMKRRICLPLPPTCLNLHPIVGRAILLRHPWISSSRRCRTINLLSIDYAFRPRLRDRLTLSGLTFLRKP